MPPLAESSLVRRKDSRRKDQKNSPIMRNDLHNSLGLPRVAFVEYYIFSISNSNPSILSLVQNINKDSIVLSFMYLSISCVFIYIFSDFFCRGLDISGSTVNFPLGRVDILDHLLTTDSL